MAEYILDRDESSLILIDNEIYSKNIFHCYYQWCHMLLDSVITCTYGGYLNNIPYASYDVVAEGYVSSFTTPTPNNEVSSSWHLRFYWNMPLNCFNYWWLWRWTGMITPERILVLLEKARFVATLLFILVIVIIVTVITL